MNNEEGEKDNFVNKQLQNIKLMSSNNVSEDNSEKELNLRMSEDDIEDEQFAITQQHEQALNGILVNPSGNFGRCHYLLIHVRFQDNFYTFFFYIFRNTS